MKIPEQMAPARLCASKAPLSSRTDGVRLQGCNVFEWASCAAAIAGCTALSGPALIACVASVAPGCVKCVS
jgi:hypothetical protein